MKMGTNLSTERSWNNFGLDTKIPYRVQRNQNSPHFEVKNGLVLEHLKSFNLRTQPSLA